MVKVSITGALSLPRKTIVQMIEHSTSATFSPDVTYDVNYLIASRFDTEKAKHAAKIGVTVISENEMFDFIRTGDFPENSKPVRPHTYPPNFRDDEIVWSEEITPPSLCFLEYSDNEGAVTQRFVFLACKGKGSNGKDYWGAFDKERFKTFRVDRVIKLEQI
jgi:hypothetical protein